MTTPTLTIEQAIALCGVLNSNCSTPAAKTEDRKERPVLVTTEYRGVFFGYASDTSGDTINLRAARNCIYWSAATKGFLGLVSKGPDKDCRVGPPADIELRRITCVAEVSAEAAKAWEAAPWKS